MEASSPETSLFKKLNLSLWIPVVLAFVAVSTAWYLLIQIAKDNPTQTVPLETAAAQSAH